MARGRTTGRPKASVITAIIPDARRRPVAEPSVVAAARPPDLVVIMSAKDWVCARCTGTGDLLTMDDAGLLCMTCADLDHLVRHQDTDYDSLLMSGVPPRRCPRSRPPRLDRILAQLGAKRPAVLSAAGRGRERWRSASHLAVTSFGPNGPSSRSARQHAHDNHQKWQPVAILLIHLRHPDTKGHAYLDGRKRCPQRGEPKRASRPIVSEEAVSGQLGNEDIR